MPRILTSTGSEELLSLIASARLHALDPELYLRDLLRVLPHWPRYRFLELAPKLWPRTRDRLAPFELAADVGPLTVPPTINPPAEQEPSAQS
jgi:transposase